MKQLHFTGFSYWYKDNLYTTLRADFGYTLLYGKHNKGINVLIIASKSYEEQQKTILKKIVAVRDFRQGGNNEVCLMSEKKLNNWLFKHKYDKIEL